MIKSRAGIMLAVLSAGALAVGGCEVIGWVAAQFEPLETTGALYTLPKDKKVLVFVEDLSDPLNYEPVKYELARRISEELASRKLIQEVVPFHQAQDILDRSAHRLTMAQAARKAGAEVILHVNIDRFVLKDDPASQLWHGQMGVSVRVLDVDDEMLWPKDRRWGYQVKPVELPMVEDPSPAYGRQVAKQLAARIADSVVCLFCRHSPDKKR